jgi:hypothetical protein
MIAGNGEDGRGIVAKRLVKLIVVIVPFAEVVDHVAEMVQERGTFGRTRRMKVVGNAIRDFDFGGVGGLLGGSAVSDHVEGDALGGVDGVDDVGAVRSPGIREGEQLGGLAGALIETHRLGFEKCIHLFRVELLVVGRDRELRGIGSGHFFLEDRLAEQRPRQRCLGFSWHEGIPFLICCGFSMTEKAAATNGAEVHAVRPDISCSFVGSPPHSEGPR